MAEKQPSLGEKGLRIYRDFNAVVGGVALAASVVVAPPVAVALQAYGGFNLLQAGGAEVVRRGVVKRNQK